MTTPVQAWRNKVEGDLDWLRRLAFRLVRDPHDAEDALQITIEKALRSAPPDGRRPRAWLGTVLRNTVADLGRRVRRRPTMQEFMEDSTPAPLPAEETGAGQAIDLLREALSDLDAPTRQLLTERYLTGRTIIGLAEDLGVAERTVRRRIEAGISRMRCAMDRRAGGRERWETLLGAFVTLNPAGSIGATATVSIVRDELRGRSRIREWLALVNSANSAVLALLLLVISLLAAGGVASGILFGSVRDDLGHVEKRAGYYTGADADSLVFAQSGERQAIQESRPPNTRAEPLIAPDRFTIVVKRAYDSAPLDQITILGDRGIAGTTHPGAGPFRRVEASGAESPVSLPGVYASSSDDWASLYVHAPGHAWATIEIYERAFGNYEVALQQEARLEVSIPCKYLHANLRLSLWPESSKRSWKPYAAWNLDEPREDAEILIRGLAAGDYELQAELGGGGGPVSAPPIVLATARVKLSRGATSNVVLEIDDEEWLRADAVRKCAETLIGSIELPLGTPIQDVTLSLYATDSAARASVFNRCRLDRSKLQVRGGDPSVLHWIIEDVPAGEFWAVVEPFGHFVRLEVAGGDERVPVELEVPHLVEVRLYPRSGVTREILPARYAMLHAERPEGMPEQVRPRPTAHSASDDGHFKFLVVPGRYKPSAHIGPGTHGAALGLGLEERHSHFIDAGGAFIEAAAWFDPVPVVQVLLQDGERRLRTPPSIISGGLSVVPIGHSGRVSCDATALDGLLSVSAEGEYEIRLTAPPGFEPGPPRRIEAARGRVTQLVIDLERTKDPASSR